jgi:FG-GAP repeat
MRALWTIAVFLLVASTCLVAIASDDPRPATIHRAELASMGEQPNDGFGDAVAVDGNTVVVGAEGVTIGGSPTGAAYVFVKPANGWTNMTQVATLTASDDAYHFGASVAVSGDTVVIGAPWTEMNGILQQGAAYVFVKPAGGWSNMTETAKLTGVHLDQKGEDHFGSSVSIDGNTIVVAVPNVVPEYPALGYGEALIYVKPANGWANSVEKAVLYINPGFYPNLGLGYGYSVGISGASVVVGATGCCVNGQIYVGQAFVFVEPVGGWATTDNYNAELTGVDVGSGDLFGISVAIGGDTVVVGSPQQDSYGVGAAYVYVEPQNGWNNMTETAELYPLFTSQGWFGQSVAINRNAVFIGAPYTTAGGASGRGAVYLFVKPKKGWKTTSSYDAKLWRTSGYYLGQSVSISDSTAVAGFTGTSDTNGGAEVFWAGP